MASQTKQQAYETLAANFSTDNPKSKAIHERARRSLPGGNTRSVLHYEPFPLSMVQAQGSRLHDADGHEYIDFLGEYTAGLYGHSDPIILAAVREASENGLSYGSQHEDEVRLAELVKQRFPSMDLMRFTNSGTEATLMALAVAKMFTGKKKIVVFANAYHGGAFSFAGGKSSAVNAPHEYLIATYNDLSSVEGLLREERNRGDVAAIIVEPMMGSGGAIPADLEFLRGLRRIADNVGAVLVFDEVMTSRMHSGGGIQSQLEDAERPDLTTLGKYLGGGMSFGAFGGRRGIMELFDPRNPNALAHAGTFNNNVLTMAAGRAGLEHVFTPQRAAQLHEQGELLRKRLQDVCQGTILEVTGLGSIMCFHFIRTPATQVKSHKDLLGADATLSGLLHLFLLERDFYIARRGFVALSLALDFADVDGFVNAVTKFIQTYRQLIVEKNSCKL
ncbi:hypothetical protein DOTSEDRAFT_91075 [Dothistroma septosporum NZE10]|uniref:Glutamate-1-semialdehyde 2,1-aminomutase n=1 Tax=Dothistroma septosporum (strain NZE10 / CBS 128990) TaxID=675120 RepID=N1PFY9_DOTSN|nr:hypothetical protein DOTSEDRAFT_91075 [Dothistroma septosporum NZE10]